MKNQKSIFKNTLPQKKKEIELNEDIFYGEKVVEEHVCSKSCLAIARIGGSSMDHFFAIAPTRGRGFDHFFSGAARPSFFNFFT